MHIYHIYIHIKDVHLNKSSCTKETRALNVRSSRQIVSYAMIDDWETNDKIVGYAVDSLSNLKSALKTVHPIASARMIVWQMCSFIHMYVCMYVCMYVYIYMHIHLYTCKHSVFSTNMLLQKRPNWMLLENGPYESYVNAKEERKLLNANQLQQSFSIRSSL